VSSKEKALIDLLLEAREKAIERNDIEFQIAMESNIRHWFYRRELDVMATHDGVHLDAFYQWRKERAPWL